MTNAVLFKNVELVVRDVSSGGCLIESRTPLQVGTVGWLEVEFEGERRFEWFRIARVHANGAHAFLCGVEFLPLAAAGVESLRGAVGRLRQPVSAPVSQDAAGRSSGDTRNSAGDGAAPERATSPHTGDFTRKIIEFRRPEHRREDGNAVAQLTDMGALGVRGPAKEK